MDKQHLVPQIKNVEVTDNNTLYVIGVCSNPVRYNSRYRIARPWIEKMVRTPNVHLTVVEASYGARQPELNTTPTDTRYHQINVIINSHGWVKESLGCLAYRHITALVPSAQYFALVDMDVFFADDDWAQETVHQLQDFEVVQPWSDAIDLGPRGNIMKHHRSFGYMQQTSHPRQTSPKQGQYYEYAHPGFAIAFTREFAEAVFGAGGSNGPFMDWAVLGSGDHHFVWACVNAVKDTVHKKMSASYLRKCIEWQDKAYKACRGEVGYTPGYIKHWFHGPKNRRYYKERWALLYENGYDPDKQLVHDKQGIAVIVNNDKLEHAIYKYNLARSEDSIEET